MMKKSLVGLVGLVASTSMAMADQTPSCASQFSGAYLGGKIGHNSTSLFQQYTVGAVTNQTDVAVPGVTGGVFGGWGIQMPNGLYTGLELGFLLSNDTFKNNSQVKRKQTLEVAARLGFVHQNNVLLFGKLGFVSSKFDITPPAALGLQKISKRMSALLLGAGIDVALSSKIIAGLEYTYAMYPEKKQNFAAANQTDPSVPGKLKPTSHSVLFRIAYRF